VERGALKAPQPFSRKEIAFYQCDHLGTPQELTDHEGRIAWSASYKAWGEAKQAISEAGRKAGFRNPIRFQGQYFDDETGLHYNRYRYYDPVAGRFVSKDPIGLRGGINVHQYAPNPLAWVDPLGLAGKKGITPNNKGTRTTIEGGNLPQPITCYSAKAGGNGASHPVVRDLYDSVPQDERSLFHGDCGEADALSKIATLHDTQSVEQLRALTKGGSAETLRNDGKPMVCCTSCKHVTGTLGIRDSVRTRGK
jgi:RHS repeat-associated protein